MSEVIKQIESSVSSLEEQAKMINNTYKTNTDLIGKGVDHLVGIFGGETVEKIYADQMVGIQKQAKLLLSKLHTETLTEQQKIRLERLKAGKLEDVGIVQMARNTDLKQAVVNGIYGVKGEITGTLHGLKIMITGVLDLAVFMAKYAGSMLGIHPEYKIKINDQATKLFDWIKKEGRVGVQDKMFELVEQEMTRISTLPQEKQAEAIGNIAGNVIGMLTGIKTGITLATKSGEMAGKVAQAARITQKLAKRAIINTTRMTQVGNLGKQAGYIRMGSTVAEKMLNGLAESLIGYGFAKGLSATWELIRNSTVSASKKLSSMEKIITEMEEALKTETSPKQREVIQEEIRKLREEKVKIQRPNQNLDEIKLNASLLPEARIQKAESLLGGKSLSEKQKSTILNIHENMSKGIFANNYSDIRSMTNLLQKSGFKSNEIHILMSNGILGKDKIIPLYSHNNYVEGSIDNAIIPIGGTSVGKNNLLIKVDVTAKDFGELGDLAVTQEKLEKSVLANKGQNNKIDADVLALLFLVEQKIGPKLAKAGSNRGSFYQADVPASLNAIMNSGDAMCVEASLSAKQMIDGNKGLLKGKDIKTTVINGAVAWTKGDEYSEVHTFLLTEVAGKSYIFDPANPSVGKIFGPRISEVPNNFIEMIQGNKGLVEATDVITGKKAYYGTGTGGNIMDNQYIEIGGSKIIERIEKAEKSSGIKYKDVVKNGNLEPNDRLKMASSLLGRDLMPGEIRSIMRCHVGISRGVYQNNLKEIYQMAIELKRAGFTKKEVRILMENGILGKVNAQIDAYLTHIVSEKGEDYIFRGLRLVTENREFMSQIVSAIGDEINTMTALQKYLNINGQIFTDTNTWISSSMTGGRPSWEHGFIRIGTGVGGDDFHKLMIEIPEAFGLKKGNGKIEIRLRHELGHDIVERYLGTIPEKDMNLLLELYGNKGTLSPIAQDGFYMSRGRREQIGEDFAELMSLYMRNPDTYDEYIRNMSHDGTLKQKELLQVFSQHIKNAYREYLRL